MGGTIIWDKDDWLSGLHPNYSSQAGDTPAPLGNGQLTFSQSMNPYRYFGYASPGFTPTDVTNVTAVNSSALRRIVIANEVSGGAPTYFGYAIDSDTKLFQLDASTTGAITNAGVWPHTITSVSGAVSGQDVANYSAIIASAARAPKIFYSYNNQIPTTAGDALWDVGMYSLDGATFSDRFMTTTPTGAATFKAAIGTTAAIIGVGRDVSVPHPMIVGDDDVLYMADGNRIHAYDGSVGTNGQVFVDVLVLPASYRITSFAKLKQRLVIFGYKEWNAYAGSNPGSFYATDSRAYFWDYLSLDPYDSVSLNDNYCSGGFEYMGTVGCFTQGRKPVPGSTQFSTIKLFNGNEFDTLSMFDNNLPVPGGVQVVGDTIMFNAQGTIYQYGSPYPGFPDGLNKVTAGSGTTSGALSTLSTTLQVASTGSSTTGGLQKITTGFSAASMSGALAEPEFGEGFTGRAKSATFKFAKSSTGGRDISLYFVGNDLTTTTVVANLSTIDSTNIYKKYEFTSTDGFLPRFTTVKPIVVWGNGAGSGDAPVLESIKLEYEIENIES
jgi:hypothetical protein